MLIEHEVWELAWFKLVIFPVSSSEFVSNAFQQILEGTAILLGVWLPVLGLG